MATATGKPTKKAAKQPAKRAAPPKGRAGRAKAKQQARTAKMRARAGNRWMVHYDIDGPRVRLGILWFVGALVAFAVGLAGATLFFAVAFAAAAAHALRTWRARGQPVDPRVALACTGLVVACAGIGPQVMGLGVLALVGVALATAGTSGAGASGPLLARAATVLQTTLPTAVAGGCVVLLADLELWAAIALVLLASAYETGDFLIGSGAANGYEGPVAGSAAVVVTALVIAAAGVPPFGIGEALAFGILVAPLAFLGQLTASGMLPHARAFAPALRRVDSLLLAAPIWYFGIDVIVV